jgi:hypothetical protein
MKLKRLEVEKEMTCAMIGQAFEAAGYTGMEPIAVKQETNQILWHDVPGCEWGISAVELSQDWHGVIRCENDAVPLLTFCALEAQGDHVYDLGRVESFDHLDYFLQRSAGASREFEVVGIDVGTNTCLWFDHMMNQYHIQRYMRIGDEIEFVGLPTSSWNAE